ncbi:misexpression suppressor of ras 4 [Rhynchophorus ferrugineus]|uniref:misexpression suppressor of ras 4 n=1 Tax=Rhynchophorus ferrugineus TaxID=354439 RepID=UPI003FCEC62E
MEDGFESNIQPSEHVKNGDVNSIMANFPEGTVTEAKDEKNSTEPSKVNGEHNQECEESNSNLYQDSYSSESDALVIDESIPKKKKIRGKYIKKNKESVRRTSEKENEVFTGSSDIQEKLSSDKTTSESIRDFLTNDQSNNKKVEISSHNLDIGTENSSGDNLESKENFNLNADNLESSDNKVYECDNLRISSELNSKEVLTHSNPYFNESLFELSQLHHAREETTLTNTNITNREINSNLSRSSKRAKPKPKLKEYAQYLGLQPAVQFKCPKCGKSGFESLSSLQDHFLQCNAVQTLEKTTENENISGFKLTRKVFLCSACGTYYENWNLYMHMLEYHRRYICLYCLGMFSILDDLCQHIQTRHNLEPGVKNSLEDFYNTYTEPCYVVCCECNRQFNEHDNFFYHNCVPVKSSGKNKTKPIKQIIAPENHVTGDSIMVPQESPQADNSENQDKSICEDNADCVVEGKKGVYCDKQQSEVRQVDSAKHNLSETETSRNSVSDYCENTKESESVKGTIPEEVDIKKHISTDYEEETKENCSDNILDCEQDSFDSNKNSGVENHNSTENTMDIEDNFSDNNKELDDEVRDEEDEVETRKVPKLSLKLPKPNDYPDPEDSDDSDKIAMDVENNESENEIDLDKSDTDQTREQVDEEPEKTDKTSEISYPIAGPDIPIVEIELDQPLDKMDIRILLQKCLQATAPTCIYCNHSRRIAVNGKQLGLHAIAEHRYSAINKSITAEELIPESFNSRIKESLEQLQQVFFNLDSGVSEEAVTFSHVFECFLCHYSTTVHKELYLHNRKFHSKNLLLCIMCKSNFYSYSELICHLCPGVYILDYDLQFRCCMCVSDDLPSSFRLMVHLRKRHNVCDVCLEMCHCQYKLSNHVWKHKLHHFCYRCGIAYRNKPDITRHLFWKHGTESVLCKKCLQKKWPHVYHFCVPPISFTCEECNLIFSKAVSLKVHKRIHTEEKKHPCSWEDCSESFISKKLMEKHLKRHTDPPEEENADDDAKEDSHNKDEDTEAAKIEQEKKDGDESAKPVKPKVDVYDLPELNLSESDSSDSETETEKVTTEDSRDINKTENITLENDEGSNSKDLEQKSQQVDTIHEEKSEDILQPVDDTSSSVMQDIWDNFKNYQANKEKLDSMFTSDGDTKVDEPYVPDIPIPIIEEPQQLTWEIALRDHDYCAPSPKEPTDAIIEVKPALESTERVDHDYCFQTENETREEPDNDKTVPKASKDAPIQVTNKSPTRKRTSSSSSSSSDSDSSCACGSSCSCSNSSSDSSSSSSDSSNSDSSTEEGMKRQQQRRLKRKERNKATNKQPEPKVDVVTNEKPSISIEMPINESDLETTESETDEEFYDREPQKIAKKVLEERRAQLLAEMGPNILPNGSFIESTSRPPTPPAGTVDEEEQPKKKKKTKKRKKKKSEKRDSLENRTYSATLIMDSDPIDQIPTPPYYHQFHQVEKQSPVAPVTLSLSRNSPAPQTPPLNVSVETPTLLRQDSTASDTSLRASKRRRVPNKFYGYSSDEDGEKPKRNKVEINKTIPAPASPMLVPPLTIKTGQSSMAVPPRPPIVEPITLRLPRPTHPTNDFKIQRKSSIPPIRLFPPKIPPSHSRDESGTDSNDSDIDEPVQPTEPAKPAQPQLYCYCRCPYDEVSEMIGCDSSDCQIEWFHFECVGIMVPPKGQWFCPDCRKKKQQQRRELLS